MNNPIPVLPPLFLPFFSPPADASIRIWRNVEACHAHGCVRPCRIIFDLLFAFLLFLHLPFLLSLGQRRRLWGGGRREAVSGKAFSLVALDPLLFKVWTRSCMRIIVLCPRRSGPIIRPILAAMPRVAYPPPISAGGPDPSANLRGVNFFRCPKR